MATDDKQVLVTGQGPTPQSFLVPGNGQITPRAIYAHYDGTSAAGSFKPALKVTSDGGKLVGIYPISSADTVAAGASAEVSWFPRVATTGNVTAQLPVAESFLLDSRSTGHTSTTVLQTGVDYLISAQGTYTLWNLILDTGVPESVAMFPTTGGAARATTQVGLDPEVVFAFPSSKPGNPIGHSVLFQMNAGSGFAHVEPFDGAHSTPAAGHFYSYNVTGQGSTISFRINDTVDLTDNYGAILVTIYAIPGSGVGTVTSVTAADTSIVVGGTAAAPTVRTNTLDVIAADHPPAADWSNNSHKITSVTDPGAAQDAATKAYVDAHAGAVSSVFTRTGAVVAANGDYEGVVASALTGATQATRYVGGTASVAPTTGTFAVGDFVVSQTGHIFVCTVAGSPGTWVDVGSVSNTVTSVFGRTGAVAATSGDYNLNQIGNATGDYSLNSHKITNLANGSAAQDAAAFGQIPTAGLGLTKLVTVTNGSTAALDTGANAIPTGHGTLIVMVLARSAAAAATDGYKLTINGDTGSNYDDYHFQTSAATQTSGADTATGPITASGLIVGNTATAGYASPIILMLPEYANTNWNKTGWLFVGLAAAANQRWATLAIGWRNTAAINQLTVTGTTANLLTNSKMVVYGTE